MKLQPSRAALVATLLLFAAHAHAAPLGPAPAGSALLGYNPSNGHVFASVNGITSWQIRSTEILAGVVDLPDGLNAVDLVYASQSPGNEASVGQTALGRLTYTDVDLGPVARTGLESSDFTLKFSAGLGSPESLPFPVDEGPAPPGYVYGRYNQFNGHVIVSANGVGTWYIESLGNFVGAPPQLPVVVGSLITDNNDRIGQSTFSGAAGMTFADADLGPIFPAGRNPSDIKMLLLGANGYSQVSAIVIPEPSAIWLGALLAAGATILRLPITRPAGALRRCRQ